MHLLEAGYNIRKIQELSGYKDVSSTMKYIHLLNKSGFGEALPTSSQRKFSTGASGQTVSNHFITSIVQEEFHAGWQFSEQAKVFSTEGPKTGMFEGKDRRQLV